LHLGRILPKNKRIIGVGLSDFLHGDTQPLPLFAPRVAVQVYEDIFPSFALFGYVFAKRGVVFHLGTLGHAGHDLDFRAVSGYLSLR